MVAVIGVFYIVGNVSDIVKVRETAAACKAAESGWDVGGTGCNGVVAHRDTNSSAVVVVLLINVSMEHHHSATTVERYLTDIESWKHVLKCNVQKFDMGLLLLLLPLFFLSGGRIKLVCDDNRTVARERLSPSNGTLLF